MPKNAHQSAVDAGASLRLTVAEEREIDRACDRFEAAWIARQKPNLSDHLAGTAEPVRSALLRQLLILDWDYGRRAGEEPSAADYHRRFPTDAAVIDDVRAEMNGPAASTVVANVEALTWPTPTNIPDSDTNVPGPDPTRYELLHEIGHGGIGIVYRCRDRLLGRELAIKVLRETYRDNAEARRRFTEEARVGSQLQHPAIVPVYDLGGIDNCRPHFTMKLVQGQTLAVHLLQRSDPMHELPRFLGIFEQVCQAMAYAHARGVIHRDLKPANIMVGAFGEVQLMDWGFAKHLGATEKPGAGIEQLETADRRSSSKSGLLMGTPAYMPPEQARGEVACIDARADVFALGAILCEILTGRPPYVSRSVNEICVQAASGDLSEAFVRLEACGADAPLQRLVKRCLDPQRDARPTDAGAVVDELSAYLSSTQERLRQAQLERVAADARAEQAAANAKTERHARRLTLALASAAVVLIAMSAAGWWWREHVQQELALRVAATDSKIEAALADAADARTRKDWDQVRAMVARAREQNDSGTADRWTPIIDRFTADLDLIDQLEHIRNRAIQFDAPNLLAPWETVMVFYAEAFARFGIQAGQDPIEVAAGIVQRPAGVRDMIIWGIENWWLISLRVNADSDWLWSVLNGLGSDEWRVRVRKAIKARDRQALEQLAGNAELAGQPLDTVALLTFALIDNKSYDAAINLLRPIQRRHPDDYWLNHNLGRAFRLRQPPNYSEAFRYYSIARAIRPGAPTSINLGALLIKLRDWDGVIYYSRQAIELQPELAEGHLHLGVGLDKKGQAQQAQAAYRQAIALSPNLAQAHYNLGISLNAIGQWDQAIAAYEQAVRLTPADAEVYYALGISQHAKRDFVAALAAYDKAIELTPGFALAHNNRGNTLSAQGRVDDAIAAYEKAIQYEPRLDVAHSNLAGLWLNKGQVERAIAAATKAVELNGRSANNRYNLGATLYAIADWEAAIDNYRQAIRLAPNLAEVHCNLGQTLIEVGKLSEALSSLERGHALGSQRPDWNVPSHDWLSRARRLVELESKLSGLLAGAGRPIAAEERRDCAAICQFKSMNATASRLYAEVFAAQPALETSEHRIRAAKAAAQAGCGVGNDVANITEDERTRWRQQALEWLRAELASLPKDASTRDTLRFWQRDKSLAGLREPEGIAKLSAAEQESCIQFWAKVQAALAQSLAAMAAK